MTRSWRVVAAALAAVTLAGACGIAEDDEPRSIAPENVPPELLDPNPATSTTLSVSTGTSAITVYLMERVGDSERLAPVERRVNDPRRPGDRIAALFAPTTEDEADEGLTSRIPPATVLLSVVEGADDSELVVDLSRELFSIQGEALAKAFAQIVWTVTERDGGGYRNVRFLVEGEPTFVLDASGVEKEGAVTRADYAALAPEG